ncbi:DegT/DnrJ/EryC1/StrS family aminotransferase [Kitasatospora cheerisanensis]|uniref:Glutamine--scyllo-inositol aminotransferase n=1 Tax=Kitasatospora cheerisanensis KCTC 2395 TaxID=1348663 RepID=A0A066YPM3_9ACTN|nr:DegT/DnrJ/EryC1/StrS family aminotransferase [Kitasatospora cheerisanensis]KDN83162.1 glutamine--scyllo-inositol aminotransferase [Kitasatospora cheerisanensis KCTC 2395]
MSTIPVMIPWLGEEEAEAAAEAVRSGWVAQGPRVAAFERAFAEHLGVPHAVAVSSCTTALHLALLGAGVGPGDEVVVPSLSFIATANAVTYVGATPVFADVDPATGNLTPDTIAPLLTDRTRAVIAVDQGGVPVDLDAVRELAAPRGIAVVEDAACAAGSAYRGRPAGAGADIAAFSFHPRKLLTTGEGGMVTCQDGELAARLRRLREHGMSVSAADRHAGAGGAAVLETYDEIGFNHRMTDVQAAIGLVQLGKLPAMVARRRELAARYRELLGEELAGRLVAEPAYGTSNFQSLWLLLPEDAPERGEVLGSLAADGVSARRGIMAAHLEAPYKGAVRVPLPATELITSRTVILPLFHSLTEEQQERVAGALKSALTPKARSRAPHSL